ncbi:MAG: DUF2793 domain-containing protein [Hyphomicrobiaceae bacterium]|nr:DUF2793 domain-containing protein [Hyphomicrobiaceae bacterium]
MSQTPNLKLPYLLAAQAQKHVTHNEALRMLDAIVQISVADRDLTAPPGSPGDGDRYVVAAAPSGAWAGHAGEIAAYQDGAWAFFPPGEGWLVWVADEDILVTWSGTAWSTASVPSINPAPLVGVNTTADATDRLAVKADAVLMSHDDVTPGTGDMRVKVNKGAAARTASLMLQTSFSARAEIGLAGDDDFRLKVSPDGFAFRDAIVADRTSGHVALPATRKVDNFLVNGDFRINQRGFAGGALPAGAYGHDRWKADTGGASYSVAPTGIVTLTSGTLVQPVEPGLWVGLGLTLAGETLTLSVEELTGGNLTVAVGAQTATIVAGSGRRKATVTLGAGETGSILVKLTPAAGAIGFRRAKLELGTVATAWVDFTFNELLALCQRYFRKSYNIGTAPGTATAAGAAVLFDVASSTQKYGFNQRFELQMRVAPTVVWYSSVTGAANTIRQATGATGDKAVIATSSSGAGALGYPVLGSAAGGIGEVLAAQFTADAEI